MDFTEPWYYVCLPATFSAEAAYVFKTHSEHCCSQHLLETSCVNFLCSIELIVFVGVFAALKAATYWT
jgi:hypothetical protein